MSINKAAMSDTTREGNGSDFDRILDCPILFIISIPIPTSIGESNIHTLPDYPISICEMNCFYKS